MTKQLSLDDYCQLQEQFDRTPGEDDGFSASGEHYALTAILNKLGYHPRSRGDALKTAEKLLCNGYQTG